jgi:UDP-glucose 4-epimerase
VTGASGLIGRQVVRDLVAAGHAVTALQRRASPEIDGVVRQIEADIVSTEARQAAEHAEAVVHLGGRGDVQDSWRDPAGYIRTVVEGTINVLEGARHGGGAVVFPSTQRVYRVQRRPIREGDRTEPADPYALAKLAAEGACRLYAQRYGLSTRVLRVFSVYGRGQRGQGNSGVVAIFREAAEAGRPLLVDSGPRRDFLAVEDAARGLIMAVQRGRRGFQNYKLGSGQGTSLLELARMVVELSGSRSSIVSPPSEWSRGDLVADISRARRELGFEPSISLVCGVRRFIDGERATV